METYRGRDLIREIVYGGILSIGMFVYFLWVGLTQISPLESGRYFALGITLVYVFALSMAVPEYLTTVHTIIIYPDQSIEFRCLLERCTVRMPISHIGAIYRAPWFTFDNLSYNQRVFLQGKTYVIYRNGLLCLGYISTIKNAKQLVASLKRIDPAIAVKGLKFGD